MAMHEDTKWLINWADRMHGKFGPPESGYDWCRKLAYAIGEAGNDHPSPEAVALAVKWENSKFGNTHCSQCGEEFGPGDHGYSHCKSHRNT
jgi:hypothetical protein